jgi:hypothetical protein
VYLARVVAGRIICVPTSWVSEGTRLPPSDSYVIVYRAAVHRAYNIVSASGFGLYVLSGYPTKVPPDEAVHHPAKSKSARVVYGRITNGISEDTESSETADPPCSSYVIVYVCINFIPRKTNLFAIGKQEGEDDGHE